MEVTVLRISHRHGVNVHVCSSDNIAQQRLWEYVSYWWDQEMGNKNIPSDRDKAIDEYFEEMAGREHYATDNATMDYGGTKSEY